MTRKIKQILRNICLFTLTSSLLTGQIPVGIVTPKEVFAADNSEIGGYWADKYLNNLVSRGIMRGDEIGNLNPKNNVTRAEFVSMINRSLGYSEVGKMPFRDVDKNAWYADDISIAYTQGYFSGSTRSNANPDGYLTREEAVTMLCKALKIDGVKGENPSLSDSRDFKAWSRDYINASVEKEYVVGYEDGTFRPTKNITRGEVAKILSDATGEIINESGTKAFDYVDGNMTIGSTGVTLANTVVAGDIYITGGVGLGYTNFNNVRVMGEIIISGAGESDAGENSITFTDCIIDRITVNNANDKKTLTIRSDGSTLVRETTIKTNTYLEEMTEGNGGFENIILDGAKDTTLNLSGTFAQVKMIGDTNTLSIDKGGVNKVYVDEIAVKSLIYLEKNAYIGTLYADTEVTTEGKGQVENVVINASNVVIANLPYDIKIRPGIIANINGKDMGSSEAEMASSLPGINRNYPKVQDIEATSVNAIVKSNKPGTLYWVVMLEEDDVPSTNDIIKGTKTAVKSGNLKINDSDKDYEIKISGLKSAVDYVIAVVLVDEREDRSGVRSTYFTTYDNITPNFVSGYPTITSVTNSGATVALKPTKECKYYWAVLPEKSVAPTDKQLIKQTVEGAKTKGITSLSKINIETALSIGGLEESKNYDLYLVASDGNNSTPVKKLTFTTQDKTPPKFISGYPKVDKITDTSVSMIFNVDKASTINYVVCKRGQVFPEPIPPATTPPLLNSEETKEAIISGNNAFKKGSASATANKEGILAISGLAKESIYDVYIVAVDKFKNISDVQKREIKTADIYPPTAKLEFEDMIDKEPVVESEIRIVFNEVVADSISNTELTKMDPKALKENITLYDMSKPKRVAVDMDYSKIKVTEDDGKTVVTLSKEATKLSSGNSYEFELNKIKDTSGNRMSDKTILPGFKTVAPLVEMIKTASPKDYDITFRMDPQATNTANEVLFDTILNIDSNVKFVLYMAEGEEAINNKEFNPLLPVTPAPVPPDPNNPTPPALDGKESYIAKGEPVTIRYLLDMQGKNTADNPEYKFEQFNDFNVPREYALKFTEVNGNPVRASWGETVSVNVQCVIGSLNNMMAIASNVKGNLDRVVATEGAALVHYPKNFVTSASFTDMIVPSMVNDTYPSISAGDTKIHVLVRTDKPADFYYLIAPKGTVGKDGLPSALDIMNGSLKPEGGKSGKFTITSKDVEMGFYVEDLKPKTDYDMFWVLKGTPPEPSAVTKTEFSMQELTPPKFVVNKTNVFEKFENSIRVATEVDTDSTIYWVVYSSNVYPNPKKPTASDIINIVENPGAVKPIASGKVDAKANQQVIVTVEGLETALYYDFFATAQRSLGGLPAEVEPLWGIKPQDLTPPKVNVDTTITAINTPPTGSGVTISYDGEIGVKFSEPIYFRTSDGAPVLPVTADEFTNRYTSSPDKETDDPIKAGIKVKGTEGEEDGSLIAVHTVNFSFKQARPNSYIAFNYDVYDKANNLAGRLNIKFVENLEDPRLSQWVGTFTKTDTPKSQNIVTPQVPTPQVPTPPKAPVTPPKTPAAPTAPVTNAVPPKFLKQPIIVDKDSGHVDILAKVDMDSTIYWGIYPASASAPTNAEIKSGAKNAVSNGSMNVRSNVDFTLNCNGLTNGTPYQFYAFAADTKNNAESATVKMLNVVTWDKNQNLVNLNTTITDTKAGKYTGEIEIDFNESLYYKVNGDGALKPLPLNMFYQRMNSRDTTLAGSSDVELNKDNTLSGVTVKFTNAVDGSNIYFDSNIYNSEGKKLNSVTLTFDTDEEVWKIKN